MGTPPDRRQVLAAKMATGAVCGAVFGLAGYAVTVAIGISFTATHGDRLVIGGAALADWGSVPPKAPAVSPRCRSPPPPPCWLPSP